MNINNNIHPFTKNENGEDVKGYSELLTLVEKGVLPQEVLDKLSTLVKEKPGLSKKEQVNKIRDNKNKPLHRLKREIADYVIACMEEDGKFLCTANNELYWFDNSAHNAIRLHKDTEELTWLLDGEFGLNAQEPETKYTREALESHAARNGEKVTVHSQSFYDKDAQVLYIYAGAGMLYRLDGNEGYQQPKPNGTDGIFFISKPGEEPITPDWDNPIDPAEALFKDISYADVSEGGWPPELQQYFLYLYLRSTFFRSRMPTRPMIGFLGPTNSGKSVAARRIMQLLEGSRGNVISADSKEKDTMAAVVSRDHIFLDNLDAPVSEWMANLLEMVSTGITFSVAVYYHTLKECEYTPDCFVGFTAIDNPFSDREAFLNRLYIIRLKQRPDGEKKSDADIRDNVLCNRNKLWAGLLTQLNKDVKSLKENNSSTISERIADFQAIAEPLAIGDNRFYDLKASFNSLNTMRENAVRFDSPVMEILRLWSPDLGKWYTTAELYKEWNDMTHGGDPQLSATGFNFKSALSLGMHLTKIQPLLAKHFDVMTRHDSTRGWTYHFPYPAKGRKYF